MFRGVPLRPLRVDTQIIRAGRRIQSVEARLYDGPLLVSRATGLRVRLADSTPELFTPSERDPELGEPPQGTPQLRDDLGLEMTPGFARAIDGIGQSFGIVYDLEGEIARAQASLLLERR